MTWIDDDAFGPQHPFGPQTLAYGLVDEGLAVRVGNQALPLAELNLGERLEPLVKAENLNPLLAAGRIAWSELRARLTEIVTASGAPAGARLVSLSTAKLPFAVGDYVDYYSSRNHAENVGRMFRPDAAPLLPNWTHLPVGYHGRSGTVVGSGTPVVRPKGQRKAPDAAEPSYGPSTRLDIEAEIGFVCGGPVTSEVRTRNAAEHIFGVAVVNDWSARDIQAWEYVPLGPYLGKSFATSIGKWITPLDAFSAARVPVPEQPNTLLDYLVSEEPSGLDIRLEVQWNGTIVARPPFAEMNWSFDQQLAHMTVNGATVRPGDLFASGTVSGKNKEERGSFLELSWGGKEPIELADGSTRTFLEDGDTIVITGWAPGPDGSVVGLSEVTGTIRPAA
ncbi:fumarylacetoacetase [Pseudonocardiaceae bacterium YIM PH 21723]|nr:fumarylacetoacetase [Pseudonocardiaceae bacterium YIM PH 21723]